MRHADRRSEGQRTNQQEEEQNREPEHVRQGVNLLRSIRNQRAQRVVRVL